MKRAACIWLPHWPIQRLRWAEPGLEEREALEALAEHCGRFSPAVGLVPSPSPDSLWLDITGVCPLFGGEAALAEQILREFARRGLIVRVAIADTVGAAWAVARYGEEGSGFRVQGSGETPRDGGRGGQDSGDRKECRLQIADCKLQIEGTGDEANPKSEIRNPKQNLKSQIPNSKFQILNLKSEILNLKSAHCRPPTAFLVPPGATGPALGRLPIEALRLPEEIVELLHQLGIDCIAQVEALPRTELPARFGPRLLERLDQALGRLAEPLPVQPPRPQFRAHWSLESPTARREILEALLEHLITQVAARLVQAGRGAMRLECRLDCRGGNSEPRRSVLIPVGLFEPTAVVGHLLELVRMQWERLRLPAPVVSMAVEATVTAPLADRQSELFSDEPARRHPQQLALLVDRLSSRLGRRAVCGVRLLSDAQPELSWQYDPLLDGPRRGKRRQPLPAELPPRPVRLLPRPLRLETAALSPDGPPVRFQLDGRTYQIAHSWGPERIETGWWRGGTVGRDYYRVETTTGQRFWLFRRLRDGQWFLHGMFE